MKVGERGQVTVPKDIRDRFNLTPGSEVQFVIERGEIVLRKVSSASSLEKWKGHCAGSLAEMGIASVDDYIHEVRGH